MRCTIQPELSCERVTHMLEQFRLSHDSEVEQLFLFGSYARGEQTPVSDIDVGIKLKAGMTGFQKVTRLAELKRELDRIFGVYLRRVDVIDYEALAHKDLLHQSMMSDKREC